MNKKLITLYDYVYRPHENIGAVIFRNPDKSYEAMQIVPFFERKKLLYALPPKDMARICCIATCIMMEESRRAEAEFMANVKKQKQDQKQNPVFQQPSSILSYPKQGEEPCPNTLKP